MTDNATQLIDAFSLLSPDERYAVIVELARIVDSDAGPISDDELSKAGNEIFVMYDDEEAGSGQTNTR